MSKGSFYRHGVILSSAVAGLDQAFWDLLGKSVGLPVHVLLARGRLPRRLFCRHDSILVSKSRSLHHTQSGSDSNYDPTLRSEEPDNTSFCVALTTACKRLPLSLGKA